MGQTSGTAGELDQIAGSSKGDISSARHFFDTGNRFEGAEEDRTCFAFGFARDVQAIVIAVDEIHVGEAGGAEEDRGARRVAGGGVGCGVVFSEIGFGFDDSRGEGRVFGANQNFSQQLAGDPAGRAGEKSATKGDD